MFYRSILAISFFWVYVKNQNFLKKELFAFFLSNRNHLQKTCHYYTVKMCVMLELYELNWCVIDDTLNSSHKTT